MENLPSDQGRSYCSSKIPVSPDDGKEEIPYYYSRVEMSCCWAVTSALSDLVLIDLRWDSCYAAMNEAGLSMGKEEYFREYEIRNSNSRELEWEMLL